MANLLNVGLSGLNASQRGLDTTGHNIANVNTEGYSRQTVQFVARPADPIGVGYLGSGTELSAIERQYDDFLATQYRQYSASGNGYAVYNERASMIDNLLADPDSGLSTAYQDYFNAMQDVAADPTSVPARQVLLNESEQLAARFRSLGAWMVDMNRQVNSDLQGYTSQVTQLAAEIADLNNGIAAALGGGRPPNDLLDRRDQALDELSGMIAVSTVKQDNGAVNVFVGSGQPLVVDGRAGRLATLIDPNNAENRLVTLVAPGGGSPGNVTEQISGGKIGGLLAFRDEVLEPTRDQLGMLAVGFALESNRIHGGGYDLDGVAGGTLFSDYAAGLEATAENGGALSIEVAFADPPRPTDLRPTDYRLSFTSSGGWRITDLTTGQTEPLLDASNDSIGSGGGVALYDGLRFTIPNGSPAEGERYLVQPYRSAASAFEVAIADPRKLAASADGAVGNNENARALADLQSEEILYGNTASFSDGYNSLVADVGTKTRESADGAAVQGNLANQTNDARQSVSGVNLDEEAANLVKFQQAYQASAQVIAVANSLFDTLLAAVQR
jgi:flagellar hook-associated protein 1 FlgK